jgi:hypothetical protein
LVQLGPHIGGMTKRIAGAAVMDMAAVTIGLLADVVKRGALSELPGGNYNHVTSVRAPSVALTALTKFRHFPKLM